MWSQVQALLGECVYKAHELTYAGELIRCSRCGYPITGESVVKKRTGKDVLAEGLEVSSNRGDCHGIETLWRRLLDDLANAGS